MHCCSSHKLGTLVFGDPTAETYQHVNWIALTLPDRHYNKLGLEDFRSWGRGRDATYLWKEGKGRDEGKWGVSRSLFLPLSLFLFVSSFWIFILLIYSLFPFFFSFPTSGCIYFALTTRNSRKIYIYVLDLSNRSFHLEEGGRVQRYLLLFLRPVQKERKRKRKKREIYVYI